MASFEDYKNKGMFVKHYPFVVKKNGISGKTINISTKITTVKEGDKFYQKLLPDGNILLIKEENMTEEEKKSLIKN